ncbi:MAG: NAD(P)H-dependent oxidoreductase [Phycisphaeraceae bacterium]|nr:NAD(P)H-dependent oxidoreductase [Phycisphaeraceae bacterium]
MATPRILAFAGSLRRDSYNKKMVAVAAHGARAAGAEVTILDLASIPLPVFDEDLEARDGLPANGRKLKDLLIASQGLLIASPEYNSSMSAALKNVIDWASRPAQGEAPLAAFANKVVGVMSASPGALGGLRGLVHLRAVLGNIHSIVLPDQFALTMAHEAFNPDGSMKDPKKQQTVEGIGRRVAEVAGRLMG